jgi:hypothetical protein
LAVTDVVAELHVFHRLGDGQGGDAQEPAGACAAAADHQPGDNVQRPLECDRAVNVGGVLRAARFLDGNADLVEFTPECFNVRFGEMRVSGDLRDCDFGFPGSISVSA